MTEKIILWSVIHIIFISIITYVWVKDCKKIGKDKLAVSIQKRIMAYIFVLALPSLICILRG